MLMNSNYCCFFAYLPILQIYLFIPTCYKKICAPAMQKCIHAVVFLHIFLRATACISSAQRNYKPPLFPNTDRKKRRTASAMRRNSCSSKIFLSLKSFSFSEKYFFTQTSLFRYSVCVKEKIFLSFPLFPDFFSSSNSCDKKGNH